MATITSLGVGSNLDSEAIVTKLVALEKTPLKNLETQATIGKSKISEFGNIQSQFSALADAASAMASSSAWTARSASSSNTAAATISATSTANATSFSLDVDVLAKQQSVSSATITAGSYVGAGTLTFRQGTWVTTPATTFTPASGSSDIEVVVTATDTVATVAAKINSANAGVVATAFNDGTADRLLLRSKDTGVASGFRVQVTDADTTNADNTNLSRLAFDPETGAFGMAAAGIPVQLGEDAKARINGLAVTSRSNTLTGNIPGVTISLLATTTTNYGLVSETKTPVTMSVSDDVTVAVKNVQNFVTAYNALAKNLGELTKYDPTTKTPALFQADASILGLQSILRSMSGSVTVGSSVYGRLSDVGLERQLDGSLSINTSKLSAAANNGTELQKLFTTDNKSNQTNGFALKFRDFSTGVLATGGAVASKAQALQKALDRNALEQTRVNDRADAFETRLRRQYSALDGKMAGLNALSAYVAQQVATWNKSTG